MTAVAGTTDITYNKANAVNYAGVYSTDADNDKTTPPTFRNTDFPWFSSNCINFASQCVWAGFGGSNSRTDIGNKYGMDNTGSYTWWANNATSTPSWYSCRAFREYVANSKSVTEKGLKCDTGTTAYNSNQLPFTASDLIGSVLHVKGKNNNGQPGEYCHAVFVNNATGSTRDKIYYTAYSNCRKNGLLSLYFPSSNSNTLNGIYVIVPRTFSSGSTGTRVWADLLNPVAQNTSATLKGYCNVGCTFMNITIYNPSGTQVTSQTGYNTSFINYTYNFNIKGAWKIVVLGNDGTAVKSFTFVVRVY